MTAAEPASPIRIDRYLALLALLVATVLGLVLLGERERSLTLPPPIIGTLPAPPDPRLATLADERQALIDERRRLAAALATAEASLAQAEADAEQLLDESDRLARSLAAEATAREALVLRLAAVEAERDRLAAEVQRLDASHRRLAEQLAAIADASPPPAVPRDPSATLLASPPDLHSALGVLLREEAVREETAEPATTATPEAPAAQPRGTPPPAASATPGAPRRLITFDGAGGSVAEGIEAYRAGDWATARRIWGALAAAGDARAQFHFGALLFEGRDAPPDRVMAHVWLDRAVAGGNLPAIELRRQVRAAMSEAELAEALAIAAGG